MPKLGGKRLVLQFQERLNELDLVRSLLAFGLQVRCREGNIHFFLFAMQVLKVKKLFAVRPQVPSPHLCVNVRAAVLP